MRLSLALCLVALAVPARADPDRDVAATPSPPPTIALPGPPAASGTSVSAALTDGHGLAVTVEQSLGARVRLSAGGAPGPSLVEGLATVGARLLLTTEARDGVTTFVGSGYTAAGHEGRPELRVSAGAEKHLGATLVVGEVAYAQELADAQRDADVSLAALRPVAARVAVGLAGRATVDLDAGRPDGGEIRWEASGGPTASVRVGAAALVLHGGAVALATPDATRAGAFALASVAGWF